MYFFLSIEEAFGEIVYIDVDAVNDPLYAFSVVVTQAGGVLLEAFLESEDRPNTEAHQAHQ